MLKLTIVVTQEYDYVVVGSGPGGGPLAVDLAKAGSTVLLLEAGSDLLDDPTYDDLYGDPKASSTATNNAASRWDFFVRHSDDPARELEYEHITWRTANGSLHVGNSPPAGSEQLGIWYPKAATLGGGALIDNAVLVLPSDDIWEYIANVTGDESWSALPDDSEASRANDWWLGADLDARAIFRAMAGQSGVPSNMSATELDDQLVRDINAVDAGRDTLTGVFATITHTDSQGRRISPANHIRQALANNPKLPLFFELNSAYQADPRYDPNRNITTSFRYIARELIIAGGAFNSSQALKVSGLGPADELKRHNSTPMADLPGVGANLGDVYQGSVMKTSVSQGSELSLVVHDFEGYWPGYSVSQSESEFTIAFALKNSHTSNRTVTLRSADPLDVPDINFRFFEDNADADLETMLEAWEFVGDMKALVSSASGWTPVTELHPCRCPSSSQPCTAGGIKSTLKTQAYSRCRERLRLGDASIFPKPPGAFPILPTFIISKKAAKVIVEDRIG
ncbi:hypothetical protein GGR57DRAFT_493053 [Xylariaceae sp. FL1272]|nr:hypothetical protein GGR57DRAFT_493053 [Xylariaceae sp. FL1272]